MNERALRDAFGRFVTGVALATCLDAAAKPVAVTINSFVSISLRPPIVSFALGDAARCLSAFKASPTFVIQILEFAQMPLARMFARPSSSCWENVVYRRTGSGHLLIDGCVASFLCAGMDTLAVGDHVVFYGVVQALEVAEHRAPLSFCRGRFGCVYPLQLDAVPGPEAAIGWG